MVRPVVVLVV